MTHATLTQHEVYRALRVIESLARAESVRVHRDRAKQEQEDEQEFYSDDPGRIIMMMMGGSRVESGLDILANDVASLFSGLDFSDVVQLEDIRQLAQQFMTVASAANDALDDQNSPEAYAWQRTFRLLRKVSVECYPERISSEQIPNPEISLDGHDMERYIAQRRRKQVRRSASTSSTYPTNGSNSASNQLPGENEGRKKKKKKKGSKRKQD